jgi:hypothetical protein
LGHLSVLTATQDGFRLWIGREKNVDRVLEYFETNLPWVVCGYDAALEERWDTDQASFIGQVEAARREFIGG